MAAKEEIHSIDINTLVREEGGSDFVNIPR